MDRVSETRSRPGRHGCVYRAGDAFPLVLGDPFQTRPFLRSAKILSVRRGDPDVLGFRFLPSGVMGVREMG